MVNTSDAPENELEYRNGDPGAVQYGNFINYYDFNPASERIQLLPCGIIEKREKLIGLDVGCNAGDLTLALQGKMQEVSGQCCLLGIDIDANLINRAKENCKSQDLSFSCCDIMQEHGRNDAVEYLKANNVQKFDITFCFSVTMWIHLNHGDRGLHDFLKFVCDISDVVMIEPQEWKSYKTAVRRLKRNNAGAFPEFSNLKIRKNVTEEIEKFLTTECRFLIVKKTENTKWNRKIIIAKRSL